jgi:hypothetical protein
MSDVAMPVGAPGVLCRFEQNTHVVRSAVGRTKNPFDCRSQTRKVKKITKGPLIEFFVLVDWLQAL